MVSALAVTIEYTVSYILETSILYDGYRKNVKCDGMK